MNKSDESYRLLFNNPKLVRSLFEGVIQMPGLELLDWTAMQPLPSDYVSGRTLRKRQGDLVWRVPRNDEQDIYILLMLEHQSSNDPIMELRIATYCCLLYEGLIQRRLIKRGCSLPLVLPVVLYSGVERWSAPTETALLIDAAHDALAPYRLQMRFLLVDERALVRSGKLPDNNLAALLFRLEHNQGISDVQDILQQLWDCTHGSEFTELRQAFSAWTKYVLLPRALPDTPLPGVDSFLEVKDMLAENTRSWTHQWRTEGRQEGEAMLLQRLLTRKFGPLSESVQQRLKAATPAELEAWSLNILDATSLNEVFGE